MNTGGSVGIEFVRAKSYVNTQSEDVTFEGLNLQVLKGKNVVILEDLYDTGKTLEKLIIQVKNSEPLDFKVCVMLEKRVQNRKF